jgi:hypothetical protein
MKNSRPHRFANRVGGRVESKKNTRLVSSSTSAMPNDITKCRFAPFRYIGPRVKPVAMHLWLSATSHISRFSKSLRQVQALGLMDFGNPRPVL